MELRDFHVHSTYSDGINTPEEIVLSAIDKGLTVIGFSDHSFTAFDQSYCMPKEKIADYRAEISALREKYSGKITVLCGIEQDYYAKESTAKYDYVIGSVHYLKVKEQYIPVDEDAETLKKAAEQFFQGDMYALTEAYYKTVGDVVRKTGATIIGHFDLITKFNEQHHLFDETHPRYRKAWKNAARELLKSGAIFEINTGAVSRGYRTTAYPSLEIRQFIREHGGSFVLSGDSHSAENLCFRFEQENL
ncbi:MAG: histidinol-phosphatase [Clostridia bacterium]|nr:histidinol-phosphatase [Clostridia bacterium]